MSETIKCVMCETDDGKAHPVTGKPVEDFVINNRGTSYICFECLTRSAEIMTARETALTDDLEIRGIHEPVVHSEEHILPTHRAAKHRLAAEARKKKTTETKDS
jgi:hypothetical protein